MKRSMLIGKIETELTLLERHVNTLKCVIQNEPIGIIKLSELLNLPQHKVRYSLRILEEEGLIEPSPEGARTTERLPAFLENLKGILKSLEGIIEELKSSI